MESILKNATSILVIVAFAGLGYYLFTQRDAQVLAPGYTSQTQLFADTAIFLERRRLLEAARLDLSVLDQPVFRQLNNPSTPLAEVPVGRQNPFDSVNVQAR